MCVCVCVCVLSHVQLFATPWTIACQAPLSMGFPRQEYWSVLPFLPPGDHPDPGIEPTSPAYPALRVDSLLLSQQGNSNIIHLSIYIYIISSLSLYIYQYICDQWINKENIMQDPLGAVKQVYQSANPTPLSQDFWVLLFDWFILQYVI